MVVKINENYLKLKSSYLFVEVARREAEFQKNNPDADVIKMGIGDVTKPLAPSVIKAFKGAVDEMGKADTFRGYGPEQGYDFLAEEIIKNVLNRSEFLLTLMKYLLVMELNVILVIFRKFLI